jgi:hypothetical protein
MQLKIFTLTVLALSLTSVLSCSTIAHHHRQLVSAVHSESDETDPISGEWNVTFFVQGHNTPATFNLKLDGNEVTGTANSEHTGPGTVRDGKWEKNKLSFTLDFEKHESISITGTLQDAKLVGEFRTEGFVAKWEATRK